MGEERSEKRRLIKDPVWGNLEIFSWESRLLNHYLFNRLHNIVQNSSAYKVYPGLKYSRFLHTVGVSHVATQLFLSTAAKAEGEARAALATEAKRICTYLRPEAQDQIVRSIVRSYPCDKDYAVMLASIRIAALIHDIGHMPYSHVFENAIDGFRQAEFGEEIKFTEKARREQKRLRELLAPHDAEENEDGKLHEIVGKMFVGVLQKEFDGVYEIAGLLTAALEIGKSKAFPIAKGFIVGTIDADRIDFVRRDGFFSGLFKSQSE